MAIGATLAEMVTGVRAEAMQSVNSALGRNTDPLYIEILQRLQRQLWYDFAWPHLRVDRSIALAAGQRYYDFPVDLALDRIESVHVKWSGLWRPLEPGIGLAEYNAYDSDLDVRSEPAMRWAPQENDQFEVWPVPASNAMTLRFGGIKNLAPLVNPADTASLDRDLLVLLAAAEVVAESKSPRAAALQQRAQQHYAKLRQRSGGSADTVFSLGGCPAPTSTRRPTPLVAVDRGT